MTQIDEPIYCLTICLAQGKHEVYGHRGPMLEVLTEFESKEWDEDGKMRIVGICNSADRAERIVVVRLSRVESMDLFMY